MKITFIILVFCFLLSANAQRRSGTTQETASEKPPQATRSRGRTRFTTNPDYSEISDTSKKAPSESTSTNRRVVSRKRVNTNTKEAPTLERRARPIETKKPVYEVQEIINESPIDPYKRQSKPRILTGSRFETPSAAKRPPDFPSPAVDNVSPIDELYKDFGITARQFSDRRVPPRGAVVVEAADIGPVEFGSTARSIVSSRRGEVVPPRGASFVTPAVDVSFGSTARQILTSRGAEPKPIPFGNPSRQLVLTKTTEASILQEEPVEIAFLPNIPKQEENAQELEVDSEGLATTIPPLPEDLPSDFPSKENNELRQGIPESPSTVVTEPQRIRSQADRRTNGGRVRPSSNSLDATVTQASRIRGRTRASRRQDTEAEVSPAPIRVISRSPRGRRPESATLESARSRGPSVFTEDALGEASRTRTGRRITSGTSPEKITFDLTAAQSVSTRTRASARRVPTTEASASTSSSRRRGGRFSIGATEVPAPPVRPSTREIPSRSRQTQTKINSRELPPISRGFSRDILPREIVRDVGSRTGAREIPSRSSRDDTYRSNMRDISSRRGSNVEPVTRSSPNLRDAVVNENRIPETTIRPRDIQRTTVKEVPYARTSLRAEVAENEVRPTVVSSTRFREVPLRTNPITTEISRGRSRYTDNPPIIDEQKLEVLPLFESEDKIIRPTRKSRSRNSVKKENFLEDNIQTSATETDAKVTTRPAKYNRDFQSKVNIQTSSRVTVTRSQSVEAKTEASTTSVRTSKPRIKESVISEINEVTSKRTVSRKRKPAVASVTKIKSKGAEKQGKRTENEAGAVAARGTKKSEPNLNAFVKKKSSEEEIEESDNYPEPFKSLLKSKKGKKDKQQQQGSRPRSLPMGISAPLKNNNSAAEKIVISTSSTVMRSTDSPTTVVTRVTVKDDIENELIPKPVTFTTPQARGVSSARDRTSVTSKPETAAKKKQTTRVAEFAKTTKKFSRSTVAPATRQSTQKEKASRDSYRFHAKFSSSTTPKNDNLNTNPPPTVIKAGRSFTPSPPRGLYSSRKDHKNEKGEENSVRFTKKQTEPAQAAKSATAPLKKSSRYSSRYRNDISTRGVQISKSTTSTPFYVPTIPTAAYVPTVPTITPPYTTVNGGKDRDLGLEVITFDDPVNTIPSANLVNGELLATDKANKISALVKDGTTEKPVSIIERIINSLTSISTSTAAPNVTTLQTPTTTEATESSAILKLATKKPTTKDKTRQDDDYNTFQKTSSSSPLTLTSEKPTTIIQRILSSLTALQNVESNSIQVGNDFNTISSLPTTPLPKYSSRISSSTQLPAPLSSRSTSINPLNILEEIGDEQLVQKRTIGKLLAILNGLTSTHPPEELVAITPKSTNTLTANQVEQFNTIYPFKNALTSGYNSSIITQPTTITSSSTSPTTLFTPAFPSNTLIESRAGFPTTDSTTSLPSTVDFNSAFPTTLFTPSASTTIGALPTTSTPATTSITTVSPDAVSTLPTLSEEATTIASTLNDTEASTETQTPTVTSTTEPTRISIFPRLNEVDSPTQSTITQSTPTTEIPSTSSTTDIHSTFFTPPSTLPTLTKFEVSPGSVSIFSANELSNFITLDDNSFNTVTISGRANFDNTATTDNSVTTAEPTTVAGFTTESSTFPSGTTDSLITSTTDSEESSTISFNEPDEANTLSPNISVSVTHPSNQYSANNVSNRNVELSSRAGRLLNIVEDPVQNSIEVSTASTTTSTTPDYFIFAVLNNNTILRKRPPTVPNKDTPFLIVGVYPNNTIVRKFPNGTLVPMEQIIRVRGFDTSQNPPPLPEITSNQVTNDPGSAQDSNDQTVDQNRGVPQVEPNALSLDIPAGNSTNRNNNDAPTTVRSTTSTTTILPPSSTSTTTVLPPTSTSTTTVLTPISTSTTTALPPSSTSTTTVLPPSSTVAPVTSTTLAPTTAGTVASTTFSTSTIALSTSAPSTITQSPTLPTLSELLNGRTVEAFNDLINQSATTRESPNYKTIHVNQTPSFTTIATTTAGLGTTVAPSTSSSLSESTTTPGFPTTTVRYTSTSTPTTTITNSPLLSDGILESTTTVPTTVRSAVEPFITTTPPTFFPSSTIIPTFLTTLFPNLFKVTAVEAPITTPRVFSRQSFPGDILVASTTTRATTSVPLSTTRESSTTTEQTSTTTRPTTTTTRPTTTTEPSTTTRRTTTTQTTTTTERTTTSESTTTTERSTTTAKTARTKRITTTTPPPTTRRVRTRTTTLEPSTTTTNVPTTRILTSTETIVPSTTDGTVQTEPMKEFKKATKLKELTEEQRINLEAIARLEKEQEALLKQLSFLTSLNFGGANNARKAVTVKTPASINNSLANRIIAMAVARDRTRSTPQPPNSIQDQIDSLEGNKDKQREPKRSNPSLEEILRQYNVTDVDLPKDTNYGKSEDALLAAILKEQGIGPTTPQALGERIKESVNGIFEETTTTKKPKPRPRPRPTTQRPPGGRLMQGLNWLLNALAPPPLATTRRPRVKKPSVEPELLTNQPTRITPVVTAAPPKIGPGVKLSQDEIKSLINQLEEVQKNPKKASDFDFSKIKSLQNLIDINEGVEVISPGQHGATARATTRVSRPTTASPTTAATDTPTRRAKSTTAIPIASTSNSLEDDFDFDFTKPVAVTRPPLVPSLPPLRLNPVPGVDDGEPLIRSNLITAAVNVTRAISSFLGSALQGAAQGFRGLLGAGSSMVGNFAQGSSVSGDNRPG